MACLGRDGLSTGVVMSLKSQGASLENLRPSMDRGTGCARLRPTEDQCQTTDVVPHLRWLAAPAPTGRSRGQGGEEPISDESVPVHGRGESLSPTMRHGGKTLRIRQGLRAASNVSGARWPHVTRDKRHVTCDMSL
jgi:hypothetical protein